MRTPALYALIFFASGILLASHTHLPSLVYLPCTALAASLAFILFLIGRATAGRLLICLALTAAGAFLTELQSAEFPSNHVSRFTGLEAPMIAVGVVVSEPDIRPTKTYLTVEIDSLQYRGKSIASCGRIRLQIQEPTNIFNYRDRISFSGYFNRPSAGRNPGAFDYRRYLAVREITAIVILRSAGQVRLIQSGATELFVRTIVAPVRDYISSVYEHFLPPEQAAVLKGFLIGDVRNIPPAVYQRFKDTGTLHVLAASGANVGYVIATLVLALTPFRLPRRYRTLLLIGGVAIFSFLAYNEPSVLRASVMAVTALVGRALYRDANWLNTISFAALVILAFRPLYIYDLGWQLSFSAAFALILFLPTLERFLPRKKGVLSGIARYLLLILCGTLVAQLGVTPILIHNFHSVPLVSFVANLFVVPLVGVASTLGIFLVFLSAIPVVSTAVAFLLTQTLTLTLQTIDFFKSLPIPPLQMAAPHLLLIIAYYLALQLVFSLASRRKVTGLFAVMLLVCLNTLVWREVAAGPRQNLHVTFLDTYRIGATVIQQANGETVLVDGGGITRSFDYGEGAVLPFLRTKGITQLDRVIATTSDDGNIESLLSVCAGLVGEPTVDGADSLIGKAAMTRIERRAPCLLLASDSVRFLLLTKFLPVQGLNRLPDRINVAAVDWGYLEKSELVTLLQKSRFTTVVIINYPSPYVSVAPLESIRRQFPQTGIYSVLESGAVTVDIGGSGYRVWVSAND